MIVFMFNYKLFAHSNSLLIPDVHCSSICLRITVCSASRGTMRILLACLLTYLFTYLPIFLRANLLTCLLVHLARSNQATGHVSKKINR